MRRHLQHHEVISLNNDSEDWLIKVPEEPEVASASGNNQRLFNLVRNTVC